MKKLVLLFICLALAFALCSCQYLEMLPGFEQGEKEENEEEFSTAKVTFLSAYTKAQDLGFEGTLEEFIALISGKDGEDGATGAVGPQGPQGEPGKDAVAPTIEISEDGYWVINGVKTEYKATAGDSVVAVKEIAFDEDGRLVITLTDGAVLDPVEIPEKDGHKHTYGEWVSWSGNPDGCGEKLYYHVCGECKIAEWKSESAEHGFGDEYFYDDTHHWQKCGNCDYTTAKEAHDIDDSGYCTVCGQPICGTEGIIYELSNDGTYAKVVGYEGTEANVVIASVYKGAPVKEIYNESFKNNSKITAVVISPNVITIGSSAFEGCTGITSFVIPDAVTSIGSQAFQKCLSISSFTMGKGVKYIGMHAFRDCINIEAVNISDLTAWCNISFSIFDTNPLTYARNLYLDGELVTDLVIPDGVSYISTCAFEGCYSIERVVIPDSVRSIGNYTFQDCVNIVDIQLGKNLESIGAPAFSGLNKLTKIVLPDTVNYIYSGAFEGCDNLIFNEYDNAYYLGSENNPYLALIKAKNTDITSCEIHEDTKLISGAFQYCTKLASIAIPENIKSISGYSFYNCDSLISVVIPDSIKAIEYRTFEDCSNLVSVTLGTNVQSFGNDAFTNCRKLVEICNRSSMNITSSTYGNIGLYALNVFSQSSGSSKIWCDENGFMFYEDGDICYLLGYSGIQTDLILPSYCNGKKYEIHSNAFYGCANITSLTIPDSVAEIGYMAFYDCDGLTSIVIPDSVTKIDGYAFACCSSLASVTIGDEVTSIGDSAFHDECSKLVEVINKSSLNITKGSSEYGGVGSNALEVHSGESKIGNVDGYIFYTCEGVNYLIGYTGNDSELILPDNYKGENYRIHNRAFYGCDSLKSVTIPDGVTEIGKYAFWYCSNLTSVALGSGVTKIGSGAFNNCYRLVEVINKSSLDITKGSTNKGYIGCYAIEIHSGASKMDSVGEYVFYTCEGINYLIGYTGNDSELVLPANYKGENYRIHNRAFYRCDSLKSVTIPDGVTSIGEEAFYLCSSLTSVTIGSGVTEIGNYAFYACSSLTVTIPNSVTKIGEGAFRNCYSLTSVTIGSGVTEIGSNAFSDCNGLTSINVSDSNTAYKSIDGNLYTKDGKTLLQYSIRKGATHFDIPSSVTRIDAYAFSHCLSLTSVAIGKNVAEIGGYAFYFCTNLASVTIPNSVTTIEGSAFYFCTSLSSVTILDGITEIGYRTFGGCSSLTSVTIPKSVTEIGGEMFSHCSSLATINYCGSEEDWNAISKGVNWEPDCTYTVVYNYTEE